MDDVLITGGGIIPMDDIDALKTIGRWRAFPSWDQYPRYCNLYNKLGAS